MNENEYRETAGNTKEGHLMDPSVRKTHTYTILKIIILILVLATMGIVSAMMISEKTAAPPAGMIGEVVQNKTQEILENHKRYTNSVLSFVYPDHLILVDEVDGIVNLSTHETFFDAFPYPSLHITLCEPSDEIACSLEYWLEISESEKVEETKIGLRKQYDATKFNFTDDSEVGQVIRVCRPAGDLCINIIDEGFYYQQEGILEKLLSSFEFIDTDAEVFKVETEGKVIITHYDTNEIGLGQVIDFGWEGSDRVDVYAVGSGEYYKIKDNEWSGWWVAGTAPNGWEPLVSGGEYDITICPRGIKPSSDKCDSFYLKLIGDWPEISISSKSLIKDMVFQPGETIDLKIKSSDVGEKYSVSILYFGTPISNVFDEEFVGESSTANSVIDYLIKVPLNLEDGYYLLSVSQLTINGLECSSQCAVDSVGFYVGSSHLE